MKGRQVPIFVLKTAPGCIYDYQLADLQFRAFRMSNYSRVRLLGVSSLIISLAYNLINVGTSRTFIRRNTDYGIDR